MTDGQRDQLLLSLYSSVLQPTSIPGVLTALDRFLDSDGLHLLGWDRVRNSATTSMATQRITEIHGMYSAEARAMDNRFDIAMKRPIGTVHACQHYFDDRFVNRDRFYQEYLIPLAGMRYVMGSRIYSHAGEDVVIAFNHEHGRSPFSTAQLHHFQQLIPHLSNWFTQLRQTEALRAAAWSGEQGLAALEQGVLLLGQYGQVLYLNPVAEQWLAHSPAWVAGRWLQQRPIEEALQRVRKNRQTVCLPLSLPQGAFVIHLLPIPQDDSLQTSYSGKNLDLHPYGDILLLIRPRHRQHQPSTADLSSLFDLSPAESRLARALASGINAEGYATQHQLSLATVRSQIRAILTKSGEDNLQSLMRLLAAIPAL